MDNCIFCKIITGEIPAHKVYEDEDFLALLDVRPKNPGHTLIIPKMHVRWVWDVDDEHIGKYFNVVKNIANAIKHAQETELVISIVLGEEVPHAHIHLIPRFPDDGHGVLLDFSLNRDIPSEEMKRIAEKIQSFL
jgi:histidine triad (HIT) family protein